MNDWCQYNTAIRCYIYKHAIRCHRQQV